MFTHSVNSILVSYGLNERQASTYAKERQARNLVAVMSKVKPQHKNNASYKRDLTLLATLVSREQYEHYVRFWQL